MAVAEHAVSSAPAPTGEALQGLPPGPRAPAMVQTLLWTLAPTWFMDRCMASLGEMFTVTFAPSGLKFVMVADPAAVKEVFTAPPEVAPSAAANSPVRRWWGRARCW